VAVLKPNDLFLAWSDAHLIESTRQDSETESQQLERPPENLPPMSTLSSSPITPLNATALDTTTIAQEEVALQPPLPWRAESLTAEGFRHQVKRAVDVAGALTALFLLWPVMVMIALLIKFTSRGPIIFQQARRGYRGRIFQVLKFRTMTVDAEQRLVDLESSNESIGGVLFKLRNDPRVTPLGSFLRRSSLDELPQLLNVLFGQMSLVGPRPLQLRDSDKLMATHPEAYQRRLQVLPGITGPWQVGGRSELDYARMIDLDVEYAKNWSLSRDLWIICKTFLVVLFRKGAY
jgi:lipopolysaccharide/colanic/teichoic acid biosynthesis glycosyltransferase